MVDAKNWRVEIIISISIGLILVKDYFISVIGIHTEIVGIGLLLALNFIKTFKSGVVALPSSSRMVAPILAVAWLGSSLIGFEFNKSSYYAAFVVANLILALQPEKMFVFIRYLMIFNVGIQAFESITGNFLYVYVDDEYEYDEKMLSTNDGALRAKGLWGSPLNAIGITMSLALMNPANKLMWLVVCMASVLGQGRLGLGVGFLSLFLLVFFDKTSKEAKKKSLNILFLILAILLSLAAVINFGTEESIQRMLEAGSSENSQNVSRLLLWGQSIIEISKFGVLEHLFGRYGYIKALQGATESDWLRIWLDNGLIFLFVVFFLALRLIFKEIKSKSIMGVYSAIALILLMAVYPHAQSLPNGILVWIFLLQSMADKINYIKK